MICQNETKVLLRKFAVMTAELFKIGHERIFSSFSCKTLNNHSKKSMLMNLKMTFVHNKSIILQPTIS